MPQFVHGADMSKSSVGDVEITGLDAVEYGGRGRVLGRVEADSGLAGYGTAGGNGPTVRGQLRQMEGILLGEDPLAIERLYDTMMGQQHSHRPHVPTVSGVDIALHDLAGKILDRPVSELLTGRFRDAVPFYVNSAPEDVLDPESCREWADDLAADPERPSAVKLGFDEALRSASTGRGGTTIQRERRPVTETELNAVREAAGNVREALGGDMDFVAHLHNGLDLPSATRFAEAVAPARPLWLEDPLPIEYGESWRALKEAAPCRILTGEKLEGVREFAPFVENGAVDFVQPDLAFAGGITGTRRIARLADRHHVPVTAHDTSGLIQNAATVHLGASVRNFWMTETTMIDRDWIREMGETDGLVAEDGALTVPDGPGLGVELDPESVRSILADGETYWE